MEDLRKPRTIVAGTGAVVCGFVLDMLSDTLTRRRLPLELGGGWSAGSDPVRAQAVSHLGIALMFFGFALITAAVCFWLRQPPESRPMEPIDPSLPPGKTILDR